MYLNELIISKLNPSFVAAALIKFCNSCIFRQQLFCILSGFDDCLIFALNHIAKNCLSSARKARTKFPFNHTLKRMTRANFRANVKGKFRISFSVKPEYF